MFELIKLRRYKAELKKHLNSLSLIASYSVPFYNRPSTAKEIVDYVSQLKKLITTITLKQKDLINEVTLNSSVYHIQILAAGNVDSLKQFIKRNDLDPSTRESITLLLLRLEQLERDVNVFLKTID